MNRNIVIIGIKDTVFEGPCILGLTVNENQEQKYRQQED